MSSAIVSRLLALTGAPVPTAGSSLARALARCPRERLVRVMAWYAWECGRGQPSAEHLNEGIRALIRGWGDFYPTIALPSGALLVNVEEPGQLDSALVTRRGRFGRGWFKESVSTVGEVRAELALGAFWLGSVVGCIVHDDCAANPELGLACAMSGTG